MIKRIECPHNSRFTDIESIPIFIEVSHFERCIKMGMLIITLLHFAQIWKIIRSTEKIYIYIEISLKTNSFSKKNSICIFKFLNLKSETRQIDEFALTISKELNSLQHKK